jgi:hypothetical protein
VLSVISDIKTPVALGTVVSYYESVVIWKPPQKLKYL